MTQASNKTERFILLLFAGVAATILLFVTGVFHIHFSSTPAVKYGYINTMGKAVIPFEYDSVGDFHNGLATVSKDAKLFVIDTAGIRVNAKPFVYRKDILEITHILNTRSAGEFTAMNKAYARVGPASFGKTLYRIQRANQRKKDAPEQACFDFVYMFIDSLPTPGNYRMYEEAFPYSNGLALVRNETAKTRFREWQKHNWGYIGLDGSYRIRPLYTDAHSFSEGLAAVGILMTHHPN